jgi:16S rRNA U516 pseudouridylate synthase RsuA-like enzyme
MSQAVINYGVNKTLEEISSTSDPQTKKTTKETHPNKGNNIIISCLRLDATAP